MAIQITIITKTEKEIISEKVNIDIGFYKYLLKKQPTCFRLNPCFERSFFENQLVNYYNDINHD